MKIYRINWYDARSIDGWCKLNEFNEELSLIHSCGFIVKENEDAVFLSANMAIDEVEGNTYSCTIVIPKKMIKDSWCVSQKEDNS